MTRNPFRNLSAFVFLFVGLQVSSIAYADKAVAVFAGGCFWCMEKDFEALEGVTDVVSGFTGGEVENPKYSGDHRGHYEAVEVTYDPEKVTYEQLLQHFWVNIDPFDDKGQFCDKGHEYLSAIFVADAEQRVFAESSLAVVKERFDGKEIITPILPLTTFYPIAGDESYHQDFYKKSPIRYKSYRWACGRDRRLREVWGDDATV